MKRANKKEEEQIEIINKAIAELVYEKDNVLKAYNYYHGIRDPEQYRHLEENYGIGTPTSIEFIPLVRNHIDVLVGEFLSAPIQPRVSCKDEATLSNIEKDKHIAINNEIARELQRYMKNTLYRIEEGLEPESDKEVIRRIENLKEDLENNFISDYEVAAQNIVDWSIQERHIDFWNALKLLMLDLLITGLTYYRVIPSKNSTNISLKILNPYNTFVERNSSSTYLKHSQRAVLREYLTFDQILAEYGDQLTKEDIEKLESITKLSSENDNFEIFRENAVSAVHDNESEGILAGWEISPIFKNSVSHGRRTYPVYYVEWLKTDKEDGKYIVNRYEGVRIGTSVYILKGKAKNVYRNYGDDVHTTLSINGIFYADRNGKPYSLMLKTANLQDRNDILHFYRDNIIAESGTAGDWLDVALLPKFLGTDVTERLMKWKAYKKSGIALFDSSQEGNQMANTTFGGYDDTVQLQTIQAIDLAIQRNEEACSRMTGVFREKLGRVDQRDPVFNVQLGVQQSSYITKQYYQIMDLLKREILLDILNLTKVVFKNGVSGTIILGERYNKIFTALPKHYSVTEHDIHVSDSSKILQEQEMIKQLSMQLTSTGSIEPEILLDIVTSTSLSKMKQDVRQSIRRQKEENNVVGQLTEQVKELEAAVKQARQENRDLEWKMRNLSEEKNQIERDTLEFKKQLEWYKAKTDSSFKDRKIEQEIKRVELEALELIDLNPKNDEVRNK